MFTEVERIRSLSLENAELSASNQLMKCRIDAQQEVIDRLKEWIELTNGPMDTVIIKRKLNPPIQHIRGREIYEFCMVEPYMRDEQPSPNVEVLGRTTTKYE